LRGLLDSENFVIIFFAETTGKAEIKGKGGDVDGTDAV
jgi:hypothetical protein